MNFFIFICKIIYASGFEYTAISEDSLSIGDNYLEISYEIGADDQVKKCFDKLELNIKDERKEEMVKITSFYYKKIQEYTNNESDTFLAYFTTWICYFVYHPDNKIDMQKYRPELLFNLITFGRFFEFCKNDESIKLIIKDISVKLITYRLENECVDHDVWFKKAYNISVKLITYRLQNECVDPDVWFKKAYDILNAKYPFICSNIENSLNRDNKIDISMLENLKLRTKFFFKSVYNELGIFLANATLENYFSFFLILKYLFLSGKKNTSTSTIEKYSTDDRQLLNFLRSDAESIDKFPRKMNFNSYKKIAENISEPIFRKVLTVKDGFEKIYEFSGKKIQSTAKPEDSNVSLEFIENIVKRKEINYINALYVFLKNISKTEYHEYISEVLFSKAFCFKEIVTSKEKKLRSILEILFIADVLKIEFEKVNKDPSIINTYMVPFIPYIKTYLDQNDIKYDKNLAQSTFNRFLLPKTYRILKNFIFVKLFTNSSWKNKYNQLLKEYLKNKGYKFNEELVVNQNNIFIYVFKQEFSKLSPEERKKIFTIPVIQTPTSDNKTDSQKFGIRRLLLLILVTIVFIFGVIFGAYWFIYKRR
ncbi:hypothetical protein CWI38_0526p0020 [Hamiltosporidium tvaerminnensis]|uniref:Uncharacterized protein n=1 Tax=Hamiltosporidium tvaerminnensis TaxID=1176355 RepID=A0A4Q9LZC7_9MICR|nr:hypothetical protein CWI38_0526p0020 [Hamiltosporidium tvaerminnensis]